MKDQYGNDVPGDLVVLELDVNLLSEEELNLVGKVRWYEVEGHEGTVLISFAEINGLTETDPIDVDINLLDIIFQGKTVHRIDDCLKRMNGTDGFYHA